MRNYRYFQNNIGLKETSHNFDTAEVMIRRYFINVLDCLKYQRKTKSTY